MSCIPRRICIYVLIVGLGAVGCQSTNSNPDDSNGNSAENSDLANEFDVLAEPKAVNEPGLWRFMIMRDGALADSGLSYEWTIGDGAPLIGALVEYTFDEPGQYRVSVTARRADGSVAFMIYHDINVRQILALSLNNPPTADAGDDLTVTVGELVVLDGSQSADDDGDPLTFVWEQMDGTLVELESAGSVDRALFTAPNTPGDRLLFRLIVSDLEEASEDTVEVLVEPTTGVASVDCPIEFDVVGGVGDNPITGTVPLTVDLTALTPDGEPLPDGEYTWIINGVEESGPVGTHGIFSRQFTTAGTYSIALAVTLAGASAPLGCERSQDGQEAKVVEAQAAGGGGDAGAGGAGSSECQTDADCDNGDFCDGNETCIDNACVAGTAPCSSQSCDETTDTCLGCQTNADCDNGDFCDGDESCVNSVCVNGLAPCVGQSCDETADACVACVTDADCDNGVFCDGAESCVNNTCVDSVDPCIGSICAESIDACVECLTNVDCDNGNPCDGAESCVAGSCLAGAPLVCNDSNPCTDDSCNPSSGCQFVNDNSNTCNDGQFCNGQETCSSGSCQSSGDPCASGETCSESTDTCVGAPAGNVIYIDDNGSAQPGWNASAPAGSLNHPYSTLQAGANVAQPGDTVLVKAGTYTAPTGGYTTPVLTIVTSGTANAPIRFQNYNNEKVILDAEAVSSSSNNGHRRGIEIGSSYSHVEIVGFVIRNAFREGIDIKGQNILIGDCIIENCGLNSTNGESAGVKFDGSQFVTMRRCVARNCYNGFGARHAKDTLIEDCLSYDNGVALNGTLLFPENGNGFQTGVARNGSDRVHFKRCIAINNADDGWDMSHSRDCTLDNCISMDQNSLNLPDGDGGGFKIGNDQNETDPTRQMRRILVRNTIAVGNKANGIDPRDGIDGVFYNNTAYGNKGSFGFSSGATGHAAMFYNNLSWGNQQSDLFKGDNAKTADYNNWADSSGNQVPGGDVNSIRANPGFANPSAAIDRSWQGFASDDVRGILPTVNHIRNQVLANLTLTNTTPSTTSIDRGTFITRTIGAGSGVQIPVTDDATRRFRVGDEIQVQNGGRAHIVSLSSSTITVDAPLTFTSGAGVHLPYNGSAPDMGAVESP